MKNYRTLLLCSALVAFFAVLLVPQYGYARSALPGLVTFGFGGSEQEVTESFDALFPLYVPKDSLLFFNPKVTTSDALDPRVSVGLGYRRLFEEPQVIVGANVFYDNFDTINNDRINQLGLGGEMLTRWVDLRANFYLPDQKRYKIDQTQTVSTSRTSSSSTQALGPQITSQTLGFQGYNIAQITNGVNVLRTTTTSEDVQTTHFFDRYEAGMLGGDAEAGVLLPWLDRYADVRVFGGFYCFDNQFGKNIIGPEGRLEIRALPAVTFDAIFYGNKEIIGSHWFFGVRISMPFDLAKIPEGRSPFEGFGESFKPKSKEAHPDFANRLTENVIRTSRVTTSNSKLIQVATSKKVVGDYTTTQDTVTPFSQTILLTLGGVPITVTHVDSAAGTPGNGTFESPYRTLTLANTDAVKRNIVLLQANSVFNGQTINLASGQQLVGDSIGSTYRINTDQLGTIALPHATQGATPPILSNPGGTAITVANNVTVSGLNITNSAIGIAGTPGAADVTISNSTISNMTVAGININPATNITLDKLTFQNNFKDVILDAANTTISNVTSTGATNGAILLADTTGITTLTNVNISGAGLYGLRVTNPGGTHNITNLNITGGTGDGVDIQGGGGAFVFDASSSITNTGSTGFNINGGASNVTFGGTIAGSATGRSVQVQNHTGGSVSFSGSVTDIGLGINLANNTGGSIAFSGGSQMLNTGANTALTLNANNGASISFSNLAITTTTGAGIAAAGANSSVILIGTNNPGPGAPAFTFTNTSGTYDDSALTSSERNIGLAFDNTETGTYKLGSLTIANAPGAAAFSGNTTGANITLANLTVTNPAGIGLNLSGDTGSFAVIGTTTINSTGGDSINLSGITGPVNLGNVSVTNAGTTGLVLTNSSAAVTAGTVTINGATTGLQFGGNTGGSFTAAGATNLTNITTTGINANAATGSYLFNGLTIGFTGAVANTRGIDFRNSDLQFQTGNLSITGNGTATSIAIDLSGSLYPGGQPVTPNAPNILLATGAGQTAVISNVGTGVKLGDGVAGSAGAYLRYGNQTPIGSGGSGSSVTVISGGLTIDTTNLTSTTGFSQGRYEFTGITETGHASFEQPNGNPNFIFVGSTSAGNDNGSNPSNRINVAQLLTLDGTPSNLNNKTVVFVNDGSINFGATTLTLGTGTIIDGFGNGHTVVVPSAAQPANVIGDNFVLGGGSFTDPNGAATLTANAAVNVLTLASGNTVQNININGGNNQIIGSGIAGFTLSGVVQTNAAASAISLTNATGTIAMTGGSVSGAAGNAFVVDGGTAAISYSGNITNTATHSVVVQNRAGGSVTLSGAITDTGTGILVQNNTGGTTTFSGTGDTLNTGANQAVTLTNNTGATTNFTGGSLAITTTSATGFAASGGGTVGVTGTGNTMTSGTGTALSLNGVAIGSSGFVLQSVSANGAVNGIALNNLTGGGTVGVQVTGTGTTAASGGTIQNTTGAAVSLTSLGSLGGGVTLNNMNITGGGGILGTTFGTLSVANDSVSATGTAALSLTTGTIAGTFSTLSSSASTSNGVLLSGVTGSFTANAGTITGATGAAWSVVGGSVGATYSGSITQANNAALVSVSGGHTGTLTFQTGTLSATNGTGLQFNNADGTYDFNGTTTLNGGNAAIDILGGSSGTFAFSSNTSITNPTGTGFVANGSSANVTYSGNITKSGTSAGLIVDVTNESAGTVTFQTGTLSSTSSAGTGINLSNAGGTVNFNGTTTLNGGNAHVDINSGASGTFLFASGASIGATTSPTGVAFNETGSTANVTYNGTIRQTNAVSAVSINAKTGGTTTFGGAITANTTTANAINLTGNTGGTINFTGGGLAISTTTGIGFNATGGGTISVQGSGNSINSVSATALNVANTTIGASGLTFLSISSGNNIAAPEPVSGIILNNTGASGGLTVTGDGNTSVGGDSSGGTIQNTTGVGIALTSTLSPSFTNMNIQNTARSGIAGTSVTNFTFNNGTINNSGTQAVAGDADANIAFNSTSFAGAQTKNGNNISGTLTIKNSVLSNGFSAGLDIQSDAGTVTNANVSNNSVTNPGVGTAGISFVGTGNASTSFSLDNATINQNTVTNAASGGIQISIGNSNATGPGATAGIPGNSADVVAITNNAVSLKTTGTNAIIVANSGGNSASRTQTNFIISGNGRTAALGGSAPGSLGSSSIGTVILIGNNGFSTMTGTVDHNVITASHTPNLGGGNGIAGGNGVAGAGNAWTPNLTLIVTNNTISGTDGNGILLVGRGTSGTAKFKIADNNVSAPVNAGGFAAEGIRVDAGNAASANDSVFLNIFGNTSAGSNGAGGIGLRKQGTNAAVNVFGIFDSDTGLTNNPTNTDVVNFVNSLNPNGNGTDIISGSGFVRDTTQAPP